MGEVYRIQITSTAKSMLTKIKDQKTLQQITRRIDRLSQDPESQGDSLTGSLAGFRNARAANQRYRIIYEVRPRQRTVFVLGVGRRQRGNRSDIYAVMRRLVEQNLLDLRSPR